MNDFAGYEANTGLNYFTPPTGQQSSFYSSAGNNYAMSHEKSDGYLRQQQQIDGLLSSANDTASTAKGWSTGLMAAGTALQVIPGFGTIAGGLLAGVGAIVGAFGKSSAQKQQQEAQKQAADLSRFQKIDYQAGEAAFNTDKNRMINQGFSQNKFYYSGIGGN